MTNAFTKFTTDCGIERQHTVRARPQQNGVAERANRVLSERLTIMLDESGFAKAFWGEALGALVHVWNRCPTNAVKNAIPLSKCPTSASFPAPSLEVESTPSTTPAIVPRTSPAVPKPDSNPYYFPPDSDGSDSDSDDESSSDESLDHGGIWALQHLLQWML